MLQDTDQRRNEDDRAQDFQEEEGQTFIVHATEDKVGPFISKAEKFFEHLGEASDKTQTDIGVQEEPGQQHFNNQKLNNVTNADLFAVRTDQQGQNSYHNERENKMQDAVHICSKHETG